MNARVRVLPTISKRGLFVLCVGLGLVHGLIGAWVVAAIVQWIFGMSGPASMFGMFRVLLAVVAAFLLPSIPLAMLIFRVHPSVGRQVACGAMYGASCFAGILATVLGKNPEAMLEPWEPGQTGLFETVLSIGFFVGFGIVAASAFFLGTFMLGALVERFFGKRVIQQKGLICWGCGYNLGSTTIAICPECGEAFDPSARPRAKSPKVLAQFVLARWVVLVLGLLVAVVPVVFAVFVHTIPSVRFLRACPSGASLWQTTMMGNYSYLRTASGRFGSTQMPISSGWWLPDEGSADQGIVVQYLPRAKGDEAAMFVSRACLVDFGVPAAAVVAGTAPKYQLASPGTARIVSRLSREQAESVIASRGVPPGLVDALRQEAAKASWAVADPMVTPAAAGTKVEAAPYFPGMAPAAPAEPGW